MSDLTYFADLITARIRELDVRMHVVDDELGAPMTPDMNDQAIDLEGDEVLEGLGTAARKEITQLNLALARIREGSFGICASCGEPISGARLRAVLHAVLCNECAAQT